MGNPKSPSVPERMPAWSESERNWEKGSASLRHSASAGVVQPPAREPGGSSASLGSGREAQIERAPVIDPVQPGLVVPSLPLLNGPEDHLQCRLAGVQPFAFQGGQGRLQGNGEMLRPALRGAGQLPDPPVPDFLRAAHPGEAEGSSHRLAGLLRRERRQVQHVAVGQTGDAAPPEHLARVGQAEEGGENTGPALAAVQRPKHLPGLIVDGDVLGLVHQKNDAGVPPAFGAGAKELRGDIGLRPSPAADTGSEAGNRHTESPLFQELP